MNLVVDYGNTAAKVGIFDKQALTQKHTFSTLQQVEEFLTNVAAKNLLVSSVNEDGSLISSWAIGIEKKIILNPDLPLPINNLYATPKTLGVDRIAHACGALQLFPGENTLVIDTGTCVTYDFIDEQKNYHGGGIAPGLTMRFKAVHTFTARLPLVQAVDTPPLIGNSTETSIQSGIINGMISEMNGIIEQYHKKYKDLRVILCGGDSRFFENKMKASIFASPDLVLIGLNSILLYNVNT